MNKLAVSLAWMVIAVVTLSAQQSESTRAIVKSYLEMQTALASDRFEDVKGPARTLAAQAAALGREGAEVAKAATAVESAADINAAREAFGPLSTVVIARVRAEGSKDGAADLRLAYCPMVKQSWLQRGAQIRNPYYGSQMLTCGELKPLE